MAYVTLIPVAMRRPTGKFIYAPNPFLEPIKRPEVILRLADSLPMLVSFDPDGVSNPKHREAYFINDGDGWGHWHVVGEWENVEAEYQEMKGVRHG